MIGAIESAQKCLGGSNKYRQPLLVGQLGSCCAQAVTGIEGGSAADEG
jgi:hypothetical protein